MSSRPRIGAGWKSTSDSTVAATRHNLFRRPLGQADYGREQGVQDGQLLRALHPRLVLLPRTPGIRFPMAPSLFGGKSFARGIGRLRESVGARRLERHPTRIHYEMQLADVDAAFGLVMADIDEADISKFTHEERPHPHA